MIRGLTRAGLGASWSNEAFIRRAAAHGFKAADIDASALIAALGKEGAAALLAETGMTIGAVGLPVDWRGADAEFRQTLPALVESAAAAAALGCTRCVTYIPPSTDLAPARLMALAVRRLRVCAEILGAYGMRLGLEFVGPHHARTSRKHPFLWTVDDTLDMAAAIGLPNVGLLIDTYHCYTTGFHPGRLERLKAEQIVHVHINDARDLPIAALRDNDRLYTGEGVMDLKGFLAALRKTGYDGPVAQEVLTPAPPADDPETLLQRTRAGFDHVFPD